MANNIDLTICAPKPSFRRFRCSAWLIQLRQRTALSELKRSCSRFASLTLRTPHRPIVSLCFSPKRTTSRFASLSLRTPHRSPVSLCFSPKRTTFRFASLSLRLRAETFFQKVLVFCMAYFAILHHRPYGRWCFARLIQQAETLDLQPLRGLRTPHRPPVSSPLAAAAD